MEKKHFSLVVLHMKKNIFFENADPDLIRSNAQFPYHPNLQWVLKRVYTIIEKNLWYFFIDFYYIIKNCRRNARSFFYIFLNSGDVNSIADTVIHAQIYKYLIDLHDIMNKIRANQVFSQALQSLSVSLVLSLSLRPQIYKYLIDLHDIMNKIYFSHFCISISLYLLFSRSLFIVLYLNFSPDILYFFLFCLCLKYLCTGCQYG